MATNFQLGQLVWKIVGDSTALNKDLDSADKKATATAQKFKTIGGTLTKFLTVPILGAAGASVKLASDLDESLNAVSVVFGESAAVIEEWGAGAATAAGITQTQFNEAATVLGSALKNQGFALDDVAGKTIELTQRAADMASVFNTDVNDALGAIQAALRGEIDPIERYGVSVSQVRVEQKALALGLAETTSALTDQDKAAARLALIMEQTAQVSGDFANTSDGVANLTKILLAEIQQIGAELGKELLPIVKDLLAGARNLISQFSDLSDQQKSTIVTVGLLVAAIGPALSIIGNLITLVNTLKTSFAALSAAGGGPVALAIAGIVALVAAFAGLVGEATRVKNENLEKEFLGLAEATGLVGEQLAKIVVIQDDVNMRGRRTVAGIDDIIKKANKLGTEYGKTNLEILAIARANKDLTEAERERLDQAIAKEREAVAFASQYTQIARARIAERDALNAQIAEGAAQAEREAAAIAAALQLEKERVQSVVDRRAAAFEATTKAVEELDRKMAAGFITQEEGAKAVTKALEAEAEELFNIGFTGQLVETTWINTAGERVTAIAAGDRRLNEILKTLQAERLNNAIDSYEQERLDFADTASFMTEIERQRALEFAAIRNKELADQLARIEQEKVARVDAGKYIYGQLQSITSQAFANEQAALEAQKEKGLITEEQYAIEAAKIKRKQAVVDKTTSLINVAINTAEAVSKALAQTGILAPFFTGGIIALGLAQAALIAAQPLPEIPKFQFGGVVPGDPSQIDKTPALLTPGEEVITESDPRHRNNGGMQIVVPVYLDKRQIAQAVAEVVNNGQVRLNR